MPPLLELRGVSYRYPDGTLAVSEVSLRVEGGEVVALLGPSGSGKSTLLLLLAGLVKPCAGSVLYNGRELSELGGAYRSKVGILFQDPDDMLFAPTVYDDISLGPRQLSYPEEVVRERVVEVARMLGVEHLLRRAPHRLSGGEKKKVALAAVLVLEPEVLLLDEPTSELPPRDVDTVADVVNRYRRAGRAVVVASHDVEFVASVADRVYLLSGGRVVGGGEARRVLADARLLGSVGFKPPAAARAFLEVALPSDGVPLTPEELAGLIRRWLAAARHSPR